MLFRGYSHLFTGVKCGASAGIFAMRTDSPAISHYTASYVLLGIVIVIRTASHVHILQGSNGHKRGRLSVGTGGYKMLRRG